MKTTLKDKINHYKNVFSKNVSIKFREFSNHNQTLNACIIYSEGMIIHEILYKTIIQPIQRLNVDPPLPPSELIDYICYSTLTSEETVLSSSEDAIINAVFSGDTVLFINHCEKVIIINTRGWETRAIEEPKGERTIKGSQEGFTEAAIVNISLIKRRIANPALKCERIQLGKSTHSDILIVYYEDIVSPSLLDEVMTRLKHIHLDAVLDANHVAECLSDHAYSPFDTIGSSQKPDIIAAKLLEGKVALIVDNSPDVLYLPYIFYENFICGEDYYYNYLFAIFNRVIRMLSFFISSSISAIYIALVTFHQQILPKEVFMTIAVSRDGVPFPSIVELIIMLVTFEILREAGERLSLNIGQAVSIVGAIVLGEAAVSAKLISAPIVIITALSGITSLMLPKLMHALIYIRFFLLIFATFFGLYGYLFGFMFLVAYMVSIESFGINYMSYINDHTPEYSKDMLLRLPFKQTENNVKSVIRKNNAL